MAQRTLGEMLRIARAERGLSVSEAADLLGINRHTLRGLELDQQEAYYSTRKKISEGYGIPIADLVEEPALPKGEAPESEARGLEREVEGVIDGAAGMFARHLTYAGVPEDYAGTVRVAVARTARDTLERLYREEREERRDRARTESRVESDRE